MAPQQKIPVWFLCFSVLAILISADAIGLFHIEFMKYVPIAIIFAVSLGYLITNKKKVIRPDSVFFLVLILILFASPGLVINKLSNYPTSYLTAILQFFLLLSLYLIPSKDLINFQTEDMLKVVEAIGISFIVTRIVAYLLDNNPPITTHELGYVLPCAILPSFLQKKWIRFSIIMFLTFCLIILNPRTTMLLMVIVTFITPAIKFIYSKIEPKVIGSFSVLLLVLGFVFAGDIYLAVSDLDQSFKTSLGSKSNAEFRTYLIGVAAAEFLESPWYGNYFTGSSGYLIPWEGGLEVPLHNDYLDFLTKGGLLGLILFFTINILIILKGLKTRKINEIFNDKDSIVLGTTLLTSFISAMIVFAFNPVLNHVKAGFAYFFLGSMILIHFRISKLKLHLKNNKIK